MPPDLTPTAIGRLHALQRLAEAATALADARRPRDGLDPSDAAYLASYAATCRNVAARLTASAEGTR